MWVVVPRGLVVSSSDFRLKRLHSQTSRCLHSFRGPLAPRDRTLFKSFPSFQAQLFPWLLEGHMSHHCLETVLLTNIFLSAMLQLQYLDDCFGVWLNIFSAEEAEMFSVSSRYCSQSQPSVMLHNVPPFFAVCHRCFNWGLMYCQMRSSCHPQYCYTWKQNEFAWKTSVIHEHAI